MVGCFNVLVGCGFGSVDVNLFIMFLVGIFLELFFCWNIKELIS